MTFGMSSFSTGARDSRVCRSAFGTFMHDTPAAAPGENHKSNVRLRRARWYCGKHESIEARNPTGFGGSADDSSCGDGGAATVAADVVAVMEVVTVEAGDWTGAQHNLLTATQFRATF
jgi:hypothetical protein